MPEETVLPIPKKGMNKKLPLLVCSVFVIAIVAIVVAVIFIKSRSGDSTSFNPPTHSGDSSESSSSATTTPKPQTSTRVDLGNGISVENLKGSYAVADGDTSGWFKTGQSADIMFSGVDFNDSGGPLLFNHPGGIASDGKKLLLADRNNNRVLIWNTLPQSNVAADVVLGQKDFTTNNPGTGLGGLNWPVAVATDGTHVLVADTYNDRILIWTTFPVKNGQEADIVLEGQGDRNARGSLIWPWAVWTDGNKVVVTSTGVAQVLIWNTFPEEANQKPDVVLSLPGKFGTPRSIGSDGSRLVIGDHNAYGKSQGNFFWKTFPTTDDQAFDFFMPSLEASGQNGEVFWGLTFTSDGKLLALGSALGIWDSFPENENDLPDLVVGRSSGPQTLGLQGAYAFVAGDGSGTALAGEKVYLSLSNGNKIVVYNSIPVKSTQKPDFSVGSWGIDINTLETNYIISNPVPSGNGTSLFVSSDFDRKLYVWKNLPGESGAAPDLVYSLPEAPWDNALHKNTFVLAGKTTVFVWKNLPTQAQAPDSVFQNSIGSITFSELMGVAMDETYFYLSDGSADKIYVWEGLPEKNSEPKFILPFSRPGRLSSDGTYLAVTGTSAPNGGTVALYPVEGLNAGTSPTVLGGVIKDNSKVRFNLPQGARLFDGHLFVGDTGFNRVLIWEKTEDALSGKQPEVLLGYTESIPTPDAAKPQIGSDKLFWPAVPCFDGKYLWVGEFKFSERILRFSPVEAEK